MISDDALAQADATGSGKGLVKGFATIDHVALINVEGTGMVRTTVQPRRRSCGMGFRSTSSVAMCLCIRSVLHEACPAEEPSAYEQCSLEMGRI